MSLARNVILFSSLALCASATAQSTFRGLGYLPAGFDTTVLGMSKNGNTVVGSIAHPNANRGFAWTPSGGFSEAYLGIAAFDATDNGIIVGQYSAANSFNEAFVYSSGAYPSIIGTAIFIASGVSQDGKTIAGPQGDPAAVLDNVAAVYTPENNGQTNLPTVPHSMGPYSVHLSDDAKVVSGSYIGLLKNTGFRWTSATGMQLLSDPDYKGSYVQGQSADGGILVGWTETPYGPQAMRWRQSDRMQVIGSADGTTSQAWGVSLDGNVIVGERTESPLGLPISHRAFIWTPSSGMQNLDQYLKTTGATGMEGWRLQRAVAVSRDGKIIAGQGIDPTGNVQGFYVTIKPPKFVDTPSVTSLSLEPNRRVGGNGVVCHIFLGYARQTAASRVAFFALDDDLVAKPSDAFNGAGGVLIPAAWDSIYRDFDTRGVAVPTVVHLESITGGTARYASMTLLPADLHIPTLSPSTVKGGASTQLTLTLNGEAPATGGTVKLKSSDPAVTVPATAVFGSYGRSKALSVKTSTVTSVKHVTITATYRGRTQSTILTVNP